MPSLRLLRAFVTLAEIGQFNTAAAQLGITQPALSLQLKDLEQRLGVTLLERRSGQLTAAGRGLLPQAHAVLTASSDLQCEAKQLQAPLAGQLRLGIIPTIAPYILPSLLPKLHKQYPQTDLQISELQTERLIEALHQGQLDVAVVALPLHHHNLQELPLFQDPFYLVAAKQHPIWNHKLSVSAIVEGSLLLLEEGHCLRDQALNFCRLPNNRTAGVSFKATSLATLLELVAGGLGVTLVPELALRREVLTNKVLRAEKLSLPSASRTVGLLYRSSHSSAINFKQLSKLLIH